MTCEQFRQTLPEFPVGVHDTEQDAHAQSCPECSILLSDFQFMLEEAPLLQGDTDPSPRVWNAIEIVLRQEGLIRDPGRATPPQPRFWRWSKAWAIVPLAAALLLGFGSVIRQRNAMQQQAVVTQPAMIGSSASMQAHRAVPAEDQQLLEEIGSRAPAMRAAYESNLQDVNAYIHDAEESARLDPNDEDAQRYLMDAYEQKAVVYQMALDRSLP